MKRIFTILLTITLLLSVVGCENAQPANVEPTVVLPEVEDNTMGSNLWDAFAALLETNPDVTPENIANALIENENAFPYDGGVMAVEPGYLTGFEESRITGFEEGAVFMPTISIVPFIGYVFTVEDSMDVDTFISNLEKLCNRRWTISTQAEQIVAGAYGNTVLFVMCPKARDGQFGIF